MSQSGVGVTRQEGEDLIVYELHVGYHCVPAPVLISALREPFRLELVWPDNVADR